MENGGAEVISVGCFEKIGHYDGYSGDSVNFFWGVSELFVFQMSVTDCWPAFQQVFTLLPVSVCWFCLKF